MREDFEVLSAVLDGDAVDIGQLEAALENPDGRRVFVDFVKLRQATANDVLTPSREFHDRVLDDLKLNKPARTRGVPFPIAAAAILLAMLLGSLMEQNVIRQVPAAPGPPEPTRILRFEPGVDWPQ